MGDAATGAASNVRRQLRELVSICWQISPAAFVAQLTAVVLLGLSDSISLLLLVPVISALDPTGTVAADSVPLLGRLGIGSISLEVALGVLVAAIVVRTMMTRWSSIAGARLHLLVVDRLRRDCLGAVLHARWEFVLSRRRSDIVDAVLVGALRVGSALQQLIGLFTAVVVGVATAAVAVIIAPLIGSIAIVISAVIASVMLPVIRRSRSVGKEYGQRSRAVMGAATDALDSLRLVRAHDAGEVWESNLTDRFAEQRSTQLAQARRVSAASAASSILLVVGTATFVLVAVRLGMEPATLLVLLVVLTRLANRATSISKMLPSLATSFGAMDDLQELTQDAMAHSERASERSVALPSSTSDTVVEFRDVTYRYPGSTPAVEHLSLAVPRGRVTALVGPSGSGKTTVIDMVLGLLRPESGRILVDGTALDDTTLHAWRARIGFVPQDTVLLPADLRTNLTWSAGRPVSDDECWAALEAASAAFTRELSAGLDTLLGDRGIRLSGGERQRVAIARALLRRPELLVCDEATSSLDLDTERAVLGSVRALCPDTTVLLVTHRVGSLEPTDHVVELSGHERTAST